jgi:cyclophilin family peptidyl-prolyl cis-trans isomerase/HEAT repeat protein
LTPRPAAAEHAGVQHPHPRLPFATTPARATRRAALVLTCLGMGCAAPDPDAGQRAGAESSELTGQLERIMALEDGRHDDDGELRELLRNGPPRLRARAALALARFELEDLGAPATEALVAALDDSDPRVREQAAFGLGLRGNATTGDASVALALVAHWQDTDPEVRAALVEAATRLTDRALVPHVLRALADHDPRVRAAAADGVQRWPWVDRARASTGAGAAPGASDGERALAREIDAAVAARAYAPLRENGVAVPGFGEAAPAGPREPEEYEVVWRALAALARRGAPSALPAFLRFGAPVTGRASAERVEARIFAAQGLARLAAHDTLAIDAADPDAFDVVRGALEALTADGDTRVVVEAVRGLGALVRRAAQTGDELAGSTVTVLGAALGHTSAHVRLVAWEAVGACPERDAVAHLLARYEDEDVPPARAAALVALARLHAPNALGAIAHAQSSRDVVERKGAASAAAALPIAEALPLLLALADDEHPKVSAEALAGLAQHAGDAADAQNEARAKLRAALDSRDSGERLAAALALRDIATAADVPALQRAALSSTGDAGPETRFEAARTLARFPDESARSTLAKLAREDVDPYVRRVVRGLLTELGRDAELLVEEAQHEVDERAGTAVAAAPVTSSPATLAAWRGPDPRVVFVTNRGDLVFELLPREAPHHVANVLELIRRGAYDGTPWHRVVPDFVVQGGDARGDGNGGGTWRGADDALRLEVTRRRYRTGSLGMPRNEDRDSGGRQIFVTHRPTPHLDGRYTIFGELVAGFDVLQQLVEGDTIVTARVLD